MKNTILSLATITFLSFISTTANAGLIPAVWDGWTQIAGEDQTGNFDKVDPGFGGQAFDAEYLFFKQNGNTVSFGLQTGFDVVDGHQMYNNQHYWAGEMVLSFGSQEFAIDFGLPQCGYSSRNSGTCENWFNTDAGVYGDVTWNNDIYFKDSGPYAITSGDLLSNLASVAGSDVVDGQTSYYRAVSFDLSKLGPLDTNHFDIHWTMSCGNDHIHGGHAVPAPSNILLLLGGVIALAFLRKKKSV